MAKFKATREMIDVFADTHPRFDELGRMIEMGLIAGLGLKEAYAAAVALNSIDSKTLRKAMRTRRL